MNRFQLTMAFRYLVSKKTTNAINIITAVTMLGMAGGSMALIIVLSAFNGFEGLVASLYNAFNPELKIEASRGKVFRADEMLLDDIADVEGVAYLSPVLEENAILRVNDSEIIGTIKGVDSRYAEFSGIRDKITRGEFVVEEKGQPYAVLGAGIAGSLGIDVERSYSPVTIYLPKRKGSSALVAAQSFTQREVMAVGSFSIQQEYDQQYMFTSIDFLRGMLTYNKGEVSAIEIALEEGAGVGAVQNRLQKLLGEAFTVKDRYQQDETLFKILKTERWAVYAILSFILAVAAFNIIGSLSMLVLEKKKDIAILKAMGATRGYVTGIFLLEGILASVIGSVVGILLATILCLLQIWFGLIQIPGSGSFVVSAYPIVLKWQDYLLVIGTVIVISAIASLAPAFKAGSQTRLIGQA